MTVHLINETRDETYCGISAKFFLTKAGTISGGEVKYLRGPVTETHTDFYTNVATHNHDFADCEDCKEEYGLILLERL
jgi:hypothetical protein